MPEESAFVGNWNSLPFSILCHWWPLKRQWSLKFITCLTFRSSAFCPHSIYLSVPYDSHNMWLFCKERETFSLCNDVWKCLWLWGQRLFGACKNRVFVCHACSSIWKNLDPNGRILKKILYWGLLLISVNRYKPVENRNIITYILHKSLRMFVKIPRRLRDKYKKYGKPNRPAKQTRINC